MNSPFCGKFRVSQKYKPGTHDGLDLVGIDSKEIHATIAGTVQYAGWENSANHAQGFGLYVCIKGTDGLYYYYGHMSETNVKTGQNVKITDVIGIEGSTGRSTGNHCHYEIRGGFYKGAKVYDVCSKSGIPNIENGVYDDGYRPAKAARSIDNKDDVKALQSSLTDHGYDCGAADGIVGTKTTKAMFNALCNLWL